MCFFSAVPNVIPPVLPVMARVSLSAFNASQDYLRWTGNALLVQLMDITQTRSGENAFRVQKDVQPVPVQYALNALIIWSLEKMDSASLMAVQVVMTVSEFFFPKNYIQILKKIIFLAEYFENGQCHSCHSTCGSCFGPTEKDCLTCSGNLNLQESRCVGVCEDGFFMESKKCSKCLHTCSECVSRNNCTSCVKGLVLQSGTCRGTCEDG